MASTYSKHPIGYKNPNEKTESLNVSEHKLKEEAPLETNYQTSSRNPNESTFATDPREEKKKDRKPNINPLIETLIANGVLEDPEYVDPGESPSVPGQKERFVELFKKLVNNVDEPIPEDELRINEDGSVTIHNNNGQKRNLVPVNDGEDWYVYDENMDPVITEKGNPAKLRGTTVASRLLQIGGVHGLSMDVQKRAQEVEKEKKERAKHEGKTLQEVRDIAKVEKRFKKGKNMDFFDFVAMGMSEDEATEAMIQQQQRNSEAGKADLAAEIELEAPKKKINVIATNEDYFDKLVGDTKGLPLSEIIKKLHKPTGPSPDTKLDTSMEFDEIEEPEVNMDDLKIEGIEESDAPPSKTLKEELQRANKQADKEIFREERAADAEGRNSVNIEPSQEAKDIHKENIKKQIARQKEKDKQRTEYTNKIEEQRSNKNVIDIRKNKDKDDDVLIDVTGDGTPDIEADWEDIYNNSPMLKATIGASRK